MENLDAATLDRFEAARRSRDPRFDGRFFVGVRTTGIFCRPVCPVRLPKRENVAFYPSAAAAAEAGFRPCLRCRPESAPGTPAWLGTSTTVRRALRLIDSGALDHAGIEVLSDRLGVSSRHLGRLFRQHLGASPQTVAMTQRLQRARQLLVETTLPITEIALSTGYGSVRRFNDHFRRVYGRAPRELRARGSTGSDRGANLQLSYRPPLDFDRVLAFIAVRRWGDHEQVRPGQFARSVHGANGKISVLIEADPTASQLRCRVDGGSASDLIEIRRRARRVFDLDADPAEIHATLARDPAMARLLAQYGAPRVCATWDAFEGAVRAVVGQQISVAATTRLMGRIADLGAWDEDALSLSPSRLAGVDPAALPMPRIRARALVELARRIQHGDVDLEEQDDDALGQSLLAIPGIGPWTAGYILMRAAHRPDALPERDLILMQAADRFMGMGSWRDLQRRAESWRPWRAYGVALLWQAMTER